MTFWLRLITRDAFFCMMVAALATALGLGSNLLRSHPLPLYGNPSVNRGEAEVVGSMGIADFKRLAVDRGAIVVDVRPYDFYANGHVPGARNIPLADLEANPPEALSKLPAHRANLLAVYCSDSSCPAAETAARLLLQHGFSHVAVFNGGWSAWKTAGLPVEMTP